MHRDFLQSENWLRFQEVAGYEVVRFTDNEASFGGIVHALPIVGKYLYTPRFPVTVNNQQPTASGNKKVSPLSAILDEAKKRNCGWVRVEPERDEILELMRKEIETLRQAQGGNLSIVRAPHDMQPRETFVIDISKSEEELLAAMKPKTRYNVRLAEKRGVRVVQSTDEKYRHAFIDLVTGTADRKGITPHPRGYYETMLETLLGDSATLFAAEHDGDILGINLVIFYGDTAIYLHGGSADIKREFMAPFLLQWEAMKEAKRRGCARYDFGGVRTENSQRITVNKKQSVSSDWAGITRFKLGFSPATEPTCFPGCYDLALSSWRYNLYRILQKVLHGVIVLKKSVNL